LYFHTAIAPAMATMIVTGCKRENDVMVYSSVDRC
jgi:hypothetical protein